MSYDVNFTCQRTLTPLVFIRGGTRCVLVFEGVQPGGYSWIVLFINWIHTTANVNMGFFEGDSIQGSNGSYC